MNVSLQDIHAYKDRYEKSVFYFCVQIMCNLTGVAKGIMVKYLKRFPCDDVDFIVLSLRTGRTESSQEVLCLLFIS